MPTSGSSSRSRAIRCSALRPCRPNASRSPRTSRIVLVGADPARGRCRARTAARARCGRAARGPPRCSTPPCVVERVDLLAGDVELGHAGPAGVDGELGAVLLGVEPDGGRLDPHRQVLGHQRDVAALGGEVHGDGEDPACRCRPAGSRPAARAGRCGSARRAACRRVADRHRLRRAARADPQVVQQPQRLPGEVARARGGARLPSSSVITTTGQHDLVLGEAQHRPRVGQQHARCRGRTCVCRLGCRRGAPRGADRIRTPQSRLAVGSAVGSTCSGCSHGRLPGRARRTGATRLRGAGAGTPSEWGRCRPSVRRCNSTIWWPPGRPAGRPGRRVRRYVGAAARLHFPARHAVRLERCYPPTPGDG